MTSDVSRVSETIEVELTYLSFLGLSPAAALSVFTAGMLISLQSHKIRHINSRQCITMRFFWVVLSHYLGKQLHP